MISIKKCYVCVSFIIHMYACAFKISMPTIDTAVVLPHIIIRIILRLLSVRKTFNLQPISDDISWISASNKVCIL